MLLLLVLAATATAVAPPAFADPAWGVKDRGSTKYPAGGVAAAAGQAGSQEWPLVENNFRVLGHSDLGGLDTNGDVWVHGAYAYVGTWSAPCDGRGVKIVDVSDLENPQLIGRLGARPGTSAEDVVVRRVSTPFFSGDLLALGIQRCGRDPALDEQTFGVEFWDVTNPTKPTKLGELGVTNGGGGVHELDLFARGNNVYALLATPFSEWFDPVPGGDFRIVEATNPRAAFQVGEWGAGMQGFAPGPFWGQGSFGATFAHSARASADGLQAYVSYWDLGVLTLDISDVTSPTLVTRTRYDADDDGDAHSVAPYTTVNGRDLLLQNDEDFDPRSPAYIRFGAGGFGIGSESPGAPALWLEPENRISAAVVKAANQGCEASDYPASTAGRIVVVLTLVDEEPACLQQEQEAAAEAAGAVAVVHEVMSETTSPQWSDFGEVGIPVLFTDEATAEGMVAAGFATLEAQQPSWGFLRIFDAATGEQVSQFDDLPFVRELPSNEGSWSIHNTEVRGNRSYSSWYSHGIVALDLSPLERSFANAPRLVGQFVPEGGVSTTPFLPSGVPNVWGVAVREDGIVFASDMTSGLWIVEPLGQARGGRR